MRGGLIAVRVLRAGVAQAVIGVTQVPPRPRLDGFTTSRTGSKPDSDERGEALANLPMRPGVVAALPQPPARLRVHGCSGMQ